ncbi:hypothetical protein VCHA54P486_110117 [Vibrio chagasii]|nr:hypothetical protein VCHA54P486_110117 [Vibrio chagasii]
MVRNLKINLVNGLLIKVAQKYKSPLRLNHRRRGFERSNFSAINTP